MTDRELDDALAKALGWGINSYDPDYFNVDHCGTVISRRDFSPATSVDALRKWVLPELERRGIAERLMVRLAADDDRAVFMGAREPARNAGHYMFRLLVMPPAVLAAAALAVLEADNA